MVTDWIELADKLGLLRESGESGGHTSAQQALEQILGDEWIESTVEHSISFKPGKELAMNCLCILRSTKAALYAYQIYKSSTGERADQAIWLIKHLAHPLSFNWIDEFLSDSNVVHWGIGVLDQLLWTEQIPYDSKAKSLLDFADKITNGKAKGQTYFIRQYMEERNSR